jgi:ribonuclease HI
MTNFYAVKKGNKIGVFKTWDECKLHTNGYKGAIFKKFNSQREAEDFISDNSKISRVNNSEFEPDYYVYTDGSCSNNGMEGAIAGIGIYFGENDIRNVSQTISGKQTNNTAELGAILHLYDIIEKDILQGKKIGIVSDSEYAIRCVTTYGKKCDEKDWTKDIPNKEIVKLTYSMYKDKTNVKFLHVSAHTGNTDLHSIGNSKADMLANQSIEYSKKTI